MGACTFGTTAKGKTAQDAFKAATTEARNYHGNSGYTGSIAEKSRFTMITVPKGMDPFDYSNGLIDARDPRVDDKYGPCGCIEIEKGLYYFFGWASE